LCKHDESFRVTDQLTKIWIQAVDMLHKLGIPELVIIGAIAAITLLFRHRKPK
jgi:Na+/glutamate symporter